MSHYRLQDDGLEWSPAENDLGVLVGNKISKLAVCPCSKQGQEHPGLYQQDWSQHSKGSIESRNLRIV